jgi:hypothetical protein
LHEINVESKAQVEYTPIFTAEVKKKFKSTYSATAFDVSQVLSITAGVHCSQGQARVRIAALVEFKALNNQTGKELLRTVLLVWQWGYGNSKLVTLQSLLSPPNKASFTYDATSLQMADGLVFLSGTAKGKGPCVFSVKPYTKDVWSANIMAGKGDISSMAVTRDGNYKYVAIAQTDGSLSVWTYEAAVNRKAESPKSLFPLCRLYGASAIPNAPQTVGDEDGYMTEDKGFCTGLAWMCSSGGGLLLLAAAFTHGMAIYHVSLPLLQEGDATKPIPAPTATTQLSQTVLLPSFVAARWASPVDRASVSWVELGPSPSLSFLLKKDSTVKAVMGVINMPLYGDATEEKITTYPFAVLASSVLSIASTDASVMDLVGYSSSGCTLVHNGGSIMALSPLLSSDDSFFRCLRSPTISAAPGLDSVGQVSETANGSDGILQIFTVTQCKREETELPSPVPNTKRLDWTPPKQRYLLCRSFVGDSKEAQDPSPEAQRAAEYGEIESVTCGNYVELVCDINMADLVPRRIICCKGSSLCAVLLSRGVEHEDGLFANVVSIAFIDTDKGELVGVREGRDVCFLPNAKPGEEQALVLSVDGSSIRMLRRAPAPEDDEDEDERETWVESDPARALLGVEADGEYVEVSRLELLSSGGEPSLFLVGTRVRDQCSCLVLGNPAKIGDDEDAWKGLIPSLEKDPVCWLKTETVQTLVCLPSFRDGRNLLAVATSSRVILLSTELRVVAKVSTKLTSPSLAPLGSHTVAYCSRDCKLRYLCSLSWKVFKWPFGDAAITSRRA